MEITLKVFTLNCWGIPFISKNRKERIHAIAKFLLESSYNIVCLQEIWSENDYLFLKDYLVNVFPYSHYFYSGVLGSGLCVFSKWLIQDIFFHQWPLNGYIHKIHHGDWFGGKGVGLCRIRRNETLINVYCTHLHAEYHEDDIYLAHRVLQAYTTAEFVNLTKSPADVSILAGDLNTAPGDLSYRLITQVPSLLDPYDIKFEGNNPAVGRPSGTCDNANNSYSDPKQVKVSPEGKRIDHILFHVKPSLTADILNFGNPLQDRVPGQPFSYSDHNAVALELRVRQASDTRQSDDEDTNKDDGVDDTVKLATTVCKEAMVTINKSKKIFLLSGGLLFMLLLGTVDFWPTNVIYDVLKIITTGLCFYYIIMGTLWNKMEMNSLKAGLSALNNYSRCRSMTSNQANQST